MVHDPSGDRDPQVENYCQVQWFANGCHLAHYGKHFNFCEEIVSKEKLGRKSCG